MKRRRHVGSSLDEFLAEDGILAEAEATALKRVVRCGKTDWARVDAMTDRDIEQAAQSDPDAAPILDEAWFRTATLVIPEK